MWAISRWIRSVSSCRREYLRGKLDKWLVWRWHKTSASGLGDDEVVQHWYYVHVMLAEMEKNDMGLPDDCRVIISMVSSRQ